MTPRVSVIITVYNGEKYLQETLDSLAAQRYSNLEIVLVDDGSTDATAAIARSCSGNLNYIYQDNSGQVAAFNRGVREATGDYIGVVDADDLWAEDKLQHQLRPLLDDAGLQMSLGQLQRFWIDGNGKRRCLPSERAMSFLAGLFRRELFRDIGPLDGGLASHYDLDWYMRAREQGVRMFIHDEVVGYYRRHGENMSNTTDEATANTAMLSMLRRSLGRRKEQTGGGTTEMTVLERQDKSRNE